MKSDCLTGAGCAHEFSVVGTRRGGMMNTDLEALADLSASYRRFADREAQGRSPSYAAFARGIAEDAEVLRFLATLPQAKRQPNLLLAAVRHLRGVSHDWQHFRRGVLADTDALRAVMLARSTQTNEPARCAVLLPILAQLQQPLALLEVGASAGLCLLPDHYGYDYGSLQIAPAAREKSFPVFNCSASAATPLPTTMPQVVWRGGLDLNPLDATDREQASWLETLVWPEQADRLANLQAALRVARAHPPRIVRGDLLDHDLATLCHEAPRAATLVVFHTAVLYYVPDQSDRQAFVDKVSSLCPYWLCNEAPGVLPAIGSRAGEPSAIGRFLLSLNGAPVAWTDPHGAAMEWISD